MGNHSINESKLLVSRQAHKECTFTQLAINVFYPSTFLFTLILIFQNEIFIMWEGHQRTKYMYHNYSNTHPCHMGETWHGHAMTGTKSDIYRIGQDPVEGHLVVFLSTTYQWPAFYLALENGISCSFVVNIWRTGHQFEQTQQYKQIDKLMTGKEMVRIVSSD